MKTIEITLDGKQIEVKPMKVRQTSKWLHKVEAEITGLVDLFLTAPEADLTDYQAIRGLVSGVVQSIPGAIDKMCDLLIEYGVPEKAVNEAYTDEVMQAFVEVVMLAVPFEALLPKLQSLISNIPQT